MTEWLPEHCLEASDRAGTDALAHVISVCGQRLLDYLETRPDVDAARIGVTGVSLGGMHSWLLAAVDHRAAAAAPMIGVQVCIRLCPCVACATQALPEVQAPVFTPEV